MIWFSLMRESEQTILLKPEQGGVARQILACDREIASQDGRIRVSTR